MDLSTYQKVFSLEDQGNIKEAGKILHGLSDGGDPMAMLELGWRYLLDEQSDSTCYTPGKSIECSRALIENGRVVFERLAGEGEAEAMRMLGYFYLGLLCPTEVNKALAVKWLLEAYKGGCHFAANDLSTYYLHIDPLESERWYRIAESHNCRVIHNEEFE